MNPEFRQTLQHFTRNLESANEAAQQNIYTFTQLYIDPCISGIKSGVHSCTASCFPNREDQLRRKQGRSRGRAEFDFDFYDDWDEVTPGTSSGLGWQTGELDGLLAGRSTSPSQPRRQRAMSYGARLRRDEVDTDPNVIPKSSYLGFLERLPFKFGATGIRYKPSAANLEENPGGLRIRDVESAEPLLPEEEEAEEADSSQKGHSRQRSGTEASYSTTTSHSSRGDLIMSDEEDDAVPLDDEFATAMLSRRTTGTGGPEEHSGGKRRSGTTSRVSSRTVSTKSIQGQDSPRLSIRRLSKAAEVLPENFPNTHEDPQTLSIVDLKREEEELQQQEELEIVQKREAAKKLAQSMGLSTDVELPAVVIKSEPGYETPVKSSSRQNATTGYFSLSSPISPSGETEPFPNIQTPSSPQSPTGTRDKSDDHPP